VLVVGDVMLDRYWFGDVDRISPEAPVPVVRIARSEERPGGAANVARNVASLGAKASLLSVVGADEAGHALERLVAADGIAASLHHDPSLPTTVKLRVIARQQQLLRIDFETRPSQEGARREAQGFRRPRARRRRRRAVRLRQGRTRAHRRDDRPGARGRPQGARRPEGRGLGQVPRRDAGHAQPAEMREVAGRWTSDADLAARADKLRRELDLEALLVTRSERG
jgi:bifunctional ADP-heptose synthase (sugar kinase/adenylyltransferase)